MVGAGKRQRVTILDVDQDVRDWLGGENWTCEVQLTMRVLPDINPDIVGRLTKLPCVKCRVVPSHTDAVVLRGSSSPGNSGRAQGRANACGEKIST